MRKAKRRTWKAWAVITEEGFLRTADAVRADAKLHSAPAWGDKIIPVLITEVKK